MRNRTAVVTKNLGLLSIRKKSKIEDQTENLARTRVTVEVNSHTVLCLCSAAEGVATT